jgi:hypothetical protein
MSLEQVQQAGNLSLAEIFSVTAQMHVIDRLLIGTLTCTLFKIQIVSAHLL